MASPPSMSLQPSRSASVSDTADQLSIDTAWNDEQEARLQHCQAELKKAQKRWSASQDLWIGEYRSLHRYEKQVDHLLELKKAHLKALKKQEAQGGKSVTTRKKKTWKVLSRTSSKVDTLASTPPDGDADDEGDEEQEEAAVEEDSLDLVERTDSIQELPLASTSSSNPPSNRRSSLSKALRRLSVAGIRDRRKTSVGDSPTNSPLSADPSGGLTPAAS